jgi:3-oxoacyl-[acyl-carrier protein] reductase
MKRPLVLITGVGRAVGIGAGIARKLASDGWDIAINHWTPYDLTLNYSDPLEPHAFAAELAASGAQLTSIPADLALPDTPKKIFDTLRVNGTPASGLMMAHCESVQSNIIDTSLESFDRHFAVNARASWQLIREFALQVPPSGGRIASLTSDHTVGNLPYGASKGAMDRIVLAAARELAPLRILSNVINPGPIDTGWMKETDRAACLARQPSGTLGTPADTAELVSFLFSEKGSWINGQLLKSDGGFSA